MAGDVMQVTALTADVAVLLILLIAIYRHDIVQYIAGMKKVS